MSRAALISAAVASLMICGPAGAAEVVVKNDSTLGGLPHFVGNFFIVGESAASWLTSPCDGDIVSARVYWQSQIGGAPQSTEHSITFFNAGAFPAPGPVMINQGGGNAVIVAPTLTDGIMNEFRYLDPPADTIPLSVPVAAGQQFVASLEFLNTNSGFPTLPSIVYDQDGCQAGLNTVDTVVQGGWNDACLLGVPGDWVIRAVVSCDETPVPIASPPTHLVLVAALTLLGAAALVAGQRVRAAP